MRPNQPYKVFLSFIVLLTVYTFYPGWAAPRMTQDITASGEINPDRPPTPSETSRAGSAQGEAISSQ